MLFRSKPWLLLLDEPSEGIQPSIVQEIGVTLASLRDEQGLALIIVEQNLDLVLDVAHRVAVFERGVIIQELNSNELRSGGLTELLGMGAARVTHSAPSAARSASEVSEPLRHSVAGPKPSSHSEPSTHGEVTHGQRRV